MQDGSKYTVYSNYLGQTLLDDLQDAATGTDTYTYYQYDAQGNPTLQAPSSAITGYWNGQSTSPVGTFNGSTSSASFSLAVSPSDSGSPVTEWDYESAPVGDSGELLASESLVDGLDASGATSGAYCTCSSPLHAGSAADSSALAAENYSNPGPAPQETYTYSPHVGLNPAGVMVTTYPVHTETVYANSNGTGAETTTYTYTWWPSGGLGSIDSTQAQTVTTTLPVVGNGSNGTLNQNGSGVAAQTVDYYDQQGNLVWSRDGNGYLTYNQYDPVTGNLIETIQNVDSTTTLPSGASLPSGWSFPTQNGLSATTDYSYDDQGRVVQTLGPIHTSPLPPGAGQGVRDVRTATWTRYDDADHTTYTRRATQSTRA